MLLRHIASKSTLSFQMNTLQSSHAPGGGKLKSDMIEELVSIAPNERNWRGICIALLVIVAVLALILFFIVLLSPPYEGPFYPGIKFTINDVIGNEFKSASFNGSWISDTEFVFRDSSGGVSIFDTRNNSARILINNSTFRMSNGVDFAVSADMKYVLITNDIKKVHTHTKKAKYRVQEVAAPSHIPLTPYLIKNSHNYDALFIQEAVWSPRGNAIVFVYKNNIFYKPEVASSTLVYQITYSGSHYVYNGIPDWLYQEEITKTRKCLWLSSDGKYLAFATFNDSKVGEFKYPVFKTNHQYPQMYALSYPKVGTVNPEVTISVTDLGDPKNGTFISISKPTLLSNNDTYFMSLVWDTSQHRFSVIWVNRQQTIFIISVCSKPNWNCQDVYEEKVPDTGGWVESSPDIVFSRKGDGFITILSITSGNGRYPQISYVDIGTKIATPIMGYGEIVVTNIRAWDQINRIIYFEATPAENPTQRHVYNISDNLSHSNVWQCLTCPVIQDVNNATKVTFETNNTSHAVVTNEIRNWTKQMNTTYWPVRSNSCRFVRSYFHHFHKSVQHYVLECLGPDVPKVLLMNVVTNEPSCLLNNQTELAAKYAIMAKPQVRMLQVELDSGYLAQVKLLLPPVLREKLDLEFPFVLYVGTLPGNQAVTDEWKVDWNTYLASSMNLVIGIVDARGSSSQSDEMKFAIHKKIGIFDVEDQLAVLLHIRENMDFIDRTRTGVWGSGYGGYVTGRLLEQDNSTFQCGVAVAPITSWAHHDSFWTERFMATPNVADNYRGYEEADLTKRAVHFKDKKLLLIHGTADKLVHYQHSMLLIHAFYKHGVLFHHLTYPDEDHDFTGSSHHVIQTVENFWSTCFGSTDYEDYDEGLSFLSFAR